MKATKARMPESSLVDADTHVESFRQTRHNRRTELVEDYVELIADLIADRGEARQVDIAQRLGVAQPTVAKMLKRLASEGLIQQRPYRGVFLTQEGSSLAEKSRERHQRRDGARRCRGHRASCEPRDACRLQGFPAEALKVRWTIDQAPSPPVC